MPNEKGKRTHKEAKSAEAYSGSETETDNELRDNKRSRTHSPEQYFPTGGSALPEKSLSNFAALLQAAGVTPPIKPTTAEPAVAHPTAAMSDEYHDEPAAASPSLEKDASFVDDQIEQTSARYRNIKKELAGLKEKTTEQEREITKYRNKITDLMEKGIEQNREIDLLAQGTGTLSDKISKEKERLTQLQRRFREQKDEYEGRITEIIDRKVSEQLKQYKAEFEKQVNDIPRQVAEMVGIELAQIETAKLRSDQSYSHGEASSATSEPGPVKPSWLNRKNKPTSREFHSYDKEGPTKASSARSEPSRVTSLTDGSTLQNSGSKSPVLG